MPKHKRHKTNYPGVYFIHGTDPTTGKPEKIFYILYRQDGKLIEEKAGRQGQDGMTAARASALRSARAKGEPSNKMRREAFRASRKAEEGRWTYDRLWEKYKTEHPKLKGLAADESRYNIYLSPTLGSKEPKDLAPLDIDRIRIALQKKKAPGTVRNVMELARRLSNFCEEKKLGPGLSFTIKVPAANSWKTESLTDEQIARLLEAIKADPDRQVATLMHMALLTGMRRGELFNLKWADVDLKRGFITIKDPKSGLDQLIPAGKAVKELLSKHPKTSPYVFPGKKGGKRTEARRTLNRIKKRAGLPEDFRPLHGLRHTYASLLASSGQVDLYTLQKLLTHKSHSMTQRYAHLRDEALTRAANVAGEIVENLIDTDLQSKSKNQ